MNNNDISNLGIDPNGYAPNGMGGIELLGIVNYLIDGGISPKFNEIVTRYSFFPNPNSDVPHMDHHKIIKTSNLIKETYRDVGGLVEALINAGCLHENDDRSYSITQKGSVVYKEGCDSFWDIFSDTKGIIGKEIHLGPVRNMLSDYSPKGILWDNA